MAEIKGLRKAFDNINRKIVKGMQKEISKELGSIANNFKKERRKGINPKTGKKYKSLSKGWEKRRDRLSTVNKTHPDYGKGNSNLTFTGKLIDSIKFRLSLRPLLTIKIEPEGTHPPYRGIRGKKLGKTQSNKDLAGYLDEQGRPIVSLSKKLSKQIRKSIKKALKRVL